MSLRLRSAYFGGMNRALLRRALPGEVYCNGRMFSAVNRSTIRIGALDSL
jgi:hypothetical protein